MKLQMFKLIVFFIICMGSFSCTKNLNDLQEYKFQWDGSSQQEKFRPLNPDTESSSFAIDNNILSFMVPYLVGTIVYEYPHNLWSIALVLANGADVTHLSPVITLAPDMTITCIQHTIGGQNMTEQVNYSGIAEVDSLDFSKQVNFIVIAPDGSTVTYLFLAVAIDDVLHYPYDPRKQKSLK